MLVTQPSLTLCGPVDCGSPGSAVRGVLQTGPWRGQPLHRPGPEEALAPRHLSVCLSSARVCCMWLFTLAPLPDQRHSERFETSQYEVFPQPGAMGQGLGGGRQRLGAQAGQGPFCVCCRITEASMSPSACIQTQFSEEKGGQAWET